MPRLPDANKVKPTPLKHEELAMRYDCDGSRCLSRRNLLKSGAFGLIGSQALTADAAPTPRRRGRAKSVIFLHQFGGPSHVDTFDMKPNAPAEIRGEYRPIQ